MKKKIIVFVIIPFIVFFIVCFYFYYNMITSRERQNNDISDCLNTKFITEQPSFCLEKESNKNIYELNIQLVRNQKIIKDTLLKNDIENKNQYLIFKIPFNEFLKTDIILVKSKNKFYEISGFAYYAIGGHWGMFGYLGDSECYFDYDKIKINGENYIGIK